MRSQRLAFLMMAAGLVAVLPDRACAQQYSTTMHNFGMSNSWYRTSNIGMSNNFYRAPNYGNPGASFVNPSGPISLNASTMVPVGAMTAPAYLAGGTPLTQYPPPAPVTGTPLAPTEGPGGFNQGMPFLGTQTQGPTEAPGEAEAALGGPAAPTSILPSAFGSAPVQPFLSSTASAYTPSRSTFAPAPTQAGSFYEPLYRVYGYVPGR
jgi:hypothetical protein